MIVIIKGDATEFPMPDGFVVEPGWDRRIEGGLERETGAEAFFAAGDGLAQPVELSVVGRALFSSVGDLLSWIDQLKTTATAAAAIEHRAHGYTRRWDVWTGRYGLQTHTGPDTGKAAGVTLTFYPKGEGVVV